MTMNEIEKLEERCNFAEAKCQQLQDQLDDALLKLERISDVLNPDNFIVVHPDKNLLGNTNEN